MSPDVSTALTTRGLTKRYKDRTVVDDLDLRVPEGGCLLYTSDAADD